MIFKQPFFGKFFHPIEILRHKNAKEYAMLRSLKNVNTL